MNHRSRAVTTAIALMIAWVATLVTDVAVLAQSMDARLERLAERLEERRVELHIPGMAIAVVKDDQVIMSRGFGVANLEDGTPVTEETLFAVGSTTKAFASTIVGMLVDEGRMGWDDAANDHLPYFNWTPRTDDADTTVTLRDLLSHRHGFTRMGLLWAGNTVSPEEVLRTASHAEPWADFRTSFNYCNIGYLAAGMASAGIEDTTWDEQVATRIFAPLGMTDANTDIEVAARDARLSLGYLWDEETEEWEHLPMRSIAACAPAGAINAHVVDMAKWVRLQLNRGTFEGERLISEEALAETWTPQIDIAPNLTYGLGWMIHEGDRRVVEHGGNIDGFAAQVGLAPDDGIGYVLLMNVTASSLQQESLGIVFETLLDDAPEMAAAAEAAAEDFSDFVGTYLGSFPPIEGQDIDVRVENGKLGVDVPGQMLYILNPPDEEGLRAFAVTDQVKISFPRNDAGEVTSLVFHQAGLELEARRKDMPIVHEVVEDDVVGMLGKYRDETGGMDVTVLVNNGRLAVDVPSQMKFDLHQPDADGWWDFRASDRMAVRFNKDFSGLVTTMTFRQNGVEQTMDRIIDPDAAPLPTVDEIMTMRRASDQMTRLAELGTIRMAGTVRFVHAGVEGTIELTFRADDAVRVDMDFTPYGTMKQALFGDEAWADTTFNDFQEMSDREVDEFRKGHPAMLIDDWRAIWDDVQVLRVDGDGDDRRIVVRMSGGEADPTTMHVDAATGDIIEMESIVTVAGLAQLNQTTRTKHYLEINGLRLPMVIETENPANGRVEMIFERIDTNIEVDDEFFQLTPADQ